MKARDFIKPSENIMVIFTHGILLEFGNDNTGLTGDWIIDINRSVDRVIIYLRDSQPNHTNTLYIANHAGVEFVEEAKKYKIKLTHVQYIGKTELKWFDFAETGSHSIRYLP